ncbi:hypothetical protein RB195_003658 [Necator americanus]
MFRLPRDMIYLILFCTILACFPVAPESDTPKTSSSQPLITDEKMKGFGALVQIINELSQPEPNGVSNNSLNESTHPVIDLNEYIMKQDAAPKNKTKEPEIVEVQLDSHQVRRTDE